MKILLVQIKNFENNSLESKIKSFFESRNYEVFIKTFDLSVPELIPGILLQESRSAEYMIGVGLAGFFVLSETDSNSRIVINPWLSPSKKLSQREAISQDLLSTLKKMETKTYDLVDAEMRVAAYGIFTPDAGTCDNSLFIKIYGRNMAGINNYSFMEDEDLFLELEKALKYFEHITSLTYWKHMPGYIKI